MKYQRVSFAPSQATAGFDLVPNQDASVEDTESVIVAITPSSAYAVGGGPAPSAISDSGAINVRVDSDNNGTIDAIDDLCEDDDPGVVVLQQHRRQPKYHHRRG